MMKKKKKQINYKIRKATLDDVKGIHALIGQYANKKNDFLLPRSLTTIYETIRDYFVCHNRKGKIIGCASLHVLWEGLAEAKGLAVKRDYQGHGIGRRLLDAILDEAIMMRISRVFALTMKPDFFIKLGFKVIDKAELPQKIWGECINCPHFPDCDEVPVAIDL
jgi:amino-acid N-acetyltransferase